MKLNPPMETNGNVFENGNTPSACLTPDTAPGLLGATPKGSVEDLSEYTDADESISSAPTEFLAEFLSAVMLKDYETALKYCKLILQYEPDNAAAKEFYPLIVEKIQLMEEEREDREGGGSSSDSENGNASAAGRSGPSSSESDSDATTASYSSLEDEEADDNGNTTRCTAAIPPQLGTTVPSPAFQSTSSDSESPTEPISQQNIAQLRAKVVPTRNK